jgi:hypothetical protein
MLKELQTYHNGEDIEFMREFVIMNGMELIGKKGCSRDLGQRPINETETKN